MTTQPIEDSAFAWERSDIDALLSPPYVILRPETQTVPIIYCSPHSGRVYTPAFVAASRLDPLTLRRSEDAFVDELFSSCVAHGAPLLAAKFPRAYLDVNREPLELDPKLISGTLPRGTNTQTARVAGGLGTIPRLVADGEDIYPGRLLAEIALLRIERLYHPFHRALAGLIEETCRRFGTAVLIDCHSMPSSPAIQPHAQRPHFVLGDRFGTSCATEITRTVTRALEAAGYDVLINRPYAGGFITEHYGRPHRRVHTLQIEINRAVYLDEATLQPRDEFALFARVLEELIGIVAGVSESWIPRDRIAAE